MPRPAYDSDNDQRTWYLKPATQVGFPPQPHRLDRSCPLCGAGPNQSCQRWVNGRVGGRDGTGYWRTLKGVHAERKRKRESRNP